MLLYFLWVMKMSTFFQKEVKGRQLKYFYINPYNVTYRCEGLPDT